MSEPVYYDDRETWKEEFKVRKGHRIHLRDGTEIRPGPRYEDPSYQTSIGKTRGHATAAWFMLPGLDSIESVDAHRSLPSVTIVLDRHGNRAAYDRQKRLAADDTDHGCEGKTAAQMGAVMAGEAHTINNPDAPLATPTVAQYAGQYLDHYRTATKTRNLPDLVRCTDSFMLYAKEAGLNVGFAAPTLRGLLLPNRDAGAPTPDDPRTRLAGSLLSEGPALVGEIHSASKQFGPDGQPPEDLARSLLSRARRLADDLAAYETLASEDLARGRANLDLARRALTVLLGAGTQDGISEALHNSD